MCWEIITEKRKVCFKQRTVCWKAIRKQSSCFPASFLPVPGGHDTSHCNFVWIWTVGSWKQKLSCKLHLFCAAEVLLPLLDPQVVFGGQLQLNWGAPCLCSWTESMHSDPGRALSTCSCKAGPAGLKPPGIRNNYSSCTDTHFQSKTQMMLIWAKLGAPKRQIQVRRTSWETKGGSEFLFSADKIRICKAPESGIHFTFQEAQGHEDPGYFFHFPSLALVTIEMGRTCSPAVISRSLCWVR